MIRISTQIRSTVIDFQINFYSCIIQKTFHAKIDRPSREQLYKWESFIDDTLSVWIYLESHSAVSVGQFQESIVLSIKKYTFGREQKLNRFHPTAVTSFIPCYVQKLQ